MGVENITARILQEARDEALKTEQEAKASEAAILENASRDASAIEADLAARAREDAGILKERRRSVAELEARKMRLAMKQETIEETFEEALKAMENMDRKDYTAYIKKQLDSYRTEGGEILLNARDRSEIGDEIRAAVSGSALSLSEETTDIRGGFILKQGRVYINASLEKLLETEKKQITAQVAGILFE